MFYSQLFDTEICQDFFLRPTVIELLYRFYETIFICVAC